jgi:glycosyltransferase involved in cell wall biosynthesis
VRTLFSLLDSSAGGGQRVAIEVARRLAADGGGIGLCVPDQGPALEEFRELGATVSRTDLQTLRRTGGVGFAAEVARGFDLLYSHTSVPGEILGARVADRAGIPHVIHRHTEPFFSPRMITRLFQQRLYRKWLGASPFIAVAPHVAASLENVGIQDDQITVVSNGVDVEAIRERAGATQMHVPQPVVGVLGRLDPTQKGQDVFVEAARRLKEPGVRFLIGGTTGPFRDQEAEMRRAAADVGVVVEDPGSAGIEFLASLDVVVMPSNYEGSPLTLFEAMALGKAIVASRIPGIAEVLEPTGAGVLVPVGDAEALADAIRPLIASPGRRDSLGKLALETVRRDHNLTRVLDQIIEVLRRSIDTSTGPRV